MQPASSKSDPNIGTLLILDLFPLQTQIKPSHSLSCQPRFRITNEFAQTTAGSVLSSQAVCSRCSLFVSSSSFSRSPSNHPTFHARIAETRRWRATAAGHLLFCCWVTESQKVVYSSSCVSMRLWRECDNWMSAVLPCIASEMMVGFGAIFPAFVSAAFHHRK